MIEQNWADVVASTSLRDAPFGDNVRSLQSALSMQELIWGTEQNASLLLQQHFDIVLASDVVYQQEAYEPLAMTLQLLFARNPRLLVLLAHKRRYASDLRFFHSLTQAGLRMRDLLRAPQQQFMTAQQLKKLDLDETFYLFQVWKCID